MLIIFLRSPPGSRRKSMKKWCSPPFHTFSVLKKTNTPESSKGVKFVPLNHQKQTFLGWILIYNGGPRQFFFCIFWLLFLFPSAGIVGNFHSLDRFIYSDYHTHTHTHTHDAWRPSSWCATMTLWGQTTETTETGKGQQQSQVAMFRQRCFGGSLKGSRCVYF